MGIFGAIRCVVRVIRNRGYEKRCHGRVIKMLSFELLSIYCIRNGCMFNDLVMWCAECTWFVFTTSDSSRTSIDTLCGKETQLRLWSLCELKSLVQNTIVQAQRWLAQNLAMKYHFRDVTREWLFLL